VSALQRGVSNPTASYLANHSAARELGSNDQRELGSNDQRELGSNDQREADNFAKLIWRQGEEGAEKALEGHPRER